MKVKMMRSMNCFKMMKIMILIRTPYKVILNKNFFLIKIKNNRNHRNKKN